ncbi:MAG: helix-turn-helix domain-containing protein [Bacteroidales bacterium]|nr:helix-turn-helix domain-containing protein [Bacteroidales bacterium]
METTDLITRLSILNQLIRLHATGNARELAVKLEVTERSVYNYIKLMKSYGAPIVYSKPCHSYIYEGEGNFFIGFISSL